MLLARYGLREWGTATIIAIAVSVGAYFLIPWPYSIGVIIVACLCWFCVAWFFRDPIRNPKTNLPPGTMLSPADGVISAIEYLDSHEATNKQPAVCIRLFLSVLNVHINRAPCDCQVVKRIYRPGKFLDARTEDSAKINESNLIILKFPNDELFGVRQVSGKIARRIVDDLHDGQLLIQAEKIGMIKFGSTTELILPRPDDVKVLVQVGDPVRSVRTPLAEIQFPF